MAEENIPSQRDKTQTDHTNTQPDQSRLQDKSIKQANQTNQGVANLPKRTWVILSSIYKNLRLKLIWIFRLVCMIRELCLTKECDFHQTLLNWT